MDTRTSNSSPCFLRVADASAASRASKMTSLSTPFSFETASTTMRISLFISTGFARTPQRDRAARDPLRVVKKSSCQTRLGDLRERHLHALPVYLDGNALPIHGHQRARVTTAPGTRNLQLDEHARTRKALEMGLRAQHSVEARRGHLEAVRRRDRILDVEQSGYLPAHSLAVVHSHALGLVDEQPHDSVRAPRGEFQVHELVP